jgi:hypothetical protein
MSWAAEVSQLLISSRSLLFSNFYLVASKAIPQPIQRRDLQCIGAARFDTDFESVRNCCLTFGDVRFVIGATVMCHFN